MKYTKFLKACMIFAFLAFISTDLVFANTILGNTTGNFALDGAMDVLIKLQRYSWPFAVVALLYSLYQYFVVGSEAYEYKVSGQKKIMAVCIITALFQCAPLIYAFATIGWK